MKNRIGSIIASLFFLCGAVIFSFLFFNCINEYQKYNVTIEELNYEKLTFDRYVKSKVGDTYEIYFMEYDFPFEIDGITQRELNKKQLRNLESGDILDVYYRNSDSKKYTYEICELKDEDISYLNFNDYLSTNKANEITGIIVCPILILIGIGISSFFIFVCFKLKWFYRGVQLLNVLPLGGA